MPISSSFPMDSFRRCSIPAAGNFTLHKYSLDRISDVVQRLTRLTPSIVALDIELSSTNFVESLILATPTTVFHISAGQNCRARTKCASHDLSTLLSGSEITLIGFGAARLALYLYKDWNCDVRCVDLSTLCSRSTLRPSTPVQVVETALGSRPEATCPIYISASYRAWAAAKVGEVWMDRIELARAVDTTILDKEALILLASMIRQYDVLDNAKPQVVENDFSHVDHSSDGLVIHNSRYKSRVRQGHQTSVILTTKAGHEIIGQAKKVSGKQTTVDVKSQSGSDDITAIRVVGKEDLTYSDLARNEFILSVLRGESELKSSDFIRYLWFPSPTSLPKQLTSARRSTNVPPSIATKLNRSQLEVANAILSNDSPLVLAHGPPGTGKTTTISTAVKVRAERREIVWIVAQSNVAVKNIAESLYKHEVDFRLLVSVEFYVEWHEHIYEVMESKLIRSDILPDDPFGLERLLGGSTVILCTISMLSNPVLTDRSVFLLRPVRNLIIDEASQISAFEYMHIFHKFNQLESVGFFGDPKQLPPYGQDIVPTMKSIFELKHLQPQALFLDVQYRMPVPIGSFISEQVYGSKLRSHHTINDFQCVSFIDVDKGEEEEAGKSWKNMAEVQTMVHLVRNYYKDKDFCIITPYDAQRAAIEKQLKIENLPWEKVFNVDSFQGHEASFVLVSVVRTSRPGFLSVDNRVNVMLTRCKTGMVIVSNSMFLNYEAQSTLLGRLAQTWEDKRGDEAWVNWRLVAERKASLPGAASMHRSGIVVSTKTITLDQTERSSQLDTVPFTSPMKSAPYGGQSSWSGRPIISDTALEHFTSTMNVEPVRLSSPPSNRPSAPDVSSISPVALSTTCGSEFPALQGVLVGNNSQMKLQGHWAKKSDTLQSPHPVKPEHHWRANHGKHKVFSINSLNISARHL